LEHEVLVQASNAIVLYLTLHYLLIRDCAEGSLLISNPVCKYDGRWNHEFVADPTFVNNAKDYVQPITGNRGPKGD